METWKGAIETADPEERDARNLSRLRDQIQRVRESSAFYRERWDAAGVDPAGIRTRDDLQQVPVVSKQELIDDQHTDPPFGTLIGVDRADLLRVYLSPGPQATYFTREDLDATIDNAAWVFWTHGVRPHDMVDVTIMYHWVIAGTIMDDGYRRIGACVLPGGIGNPRMHLENLRWTGATALFAFPTFLTELADTAREMGLDPRVDLKLEHCAIAGEMHSADLRAEMEEFWGIQVRELYGGAEVPFSAAECELGVGMHLNPDMVVEVLHPETKEPVAPGEPGVVTVSEADRIAYPAIRYWTGDLTAGLDHSPCGCGRTTPRLGRILGRVGDIPRVKGLFVVPKEVQASLAAFPSLGAFQLVVDRPGNQDRLRIRIEHAGPAEEREGLRPRIVEAVKQGTRLTAEVVLEDPGTLEGLPLVDDQRRV